jgi:hypothetical protein
MVIDTQAFACHNSIVSQTAMVFLMVLIGEHSVG